MSLTIGSLFSGIGGLELGLEWAGCGPVLWQVEREPFCRAVLAKHWPNVERFDDVTAVRRYAPVDIICGGFPCQDVSSAGKGAGLKGERSSLWWDFARILAEVRPRFVVVENVASGARRWLCAVRSHLHQRGYRTRALGVAAADVGAPHLRRRIFVVADANGDVVREQSWRSERARRPRASLARDARGEGASADVDRDGQHALAQHAEVAGAPEFDADADPSRRQGAGPGAHEGWVRSAAGAWGPPLGGLVPVVHGVSGGLAGRVRRASLRALGNAVVPQCAEVAGRVIVQIAGGVQ